MYQTLIGLLEQRAQNTAERAAFDFAGESHSYGDLWGRLNRFAADLLRRPFYALSQDVAKSLSLCHLMQHLSHGFCVPPRHLQPISLFLPNDAPLVAVGHKRHEPACLIDVHAEFVYLIGQDKG